MSESAHGEEPETPSGREDVVFRSLAHEWVLYDPETSQLHVLNATAAMVWGLCDGATTRAQMVSEIRESLAGAPDAATVRKDVDEILGRFASEGLLG